MLTTHLILEFLFDNPIVKREWRSRFRDNRTFVLIFAFCVALCWMLYRSYKAAQTDPSVLKDLWGQFVWIQTTLLLLVSPALTASSIATERETKLFEGLQLSPLHRVQIAYGKWLSGLLFVLLLSFCVLPIGMWASVLNGVPPSQALGVVGWHFLVLVFGSSVGLASSAWSKATHYAFRSVYSLILAWLTGTFASALVAGETSISLRGLVVAPAWMVHWGRTNPILASLDIVNPSPFEARWPTSALFLALVSVLSLIAAVAGAGKRFDEPIRWNRPYGEKRSYFAALRRKSAQSKPANSAKPNQPRSIYELPFAKFLRFDNPILGREVRSIFRFPPPPRGVVVVQTMLAIPVAFLYGLMVYWAFTRPESRPTIFWGVAITGLCVSVIACALMGASALARERQENTWEGLRLSLLTEREILTGKIGAAFGACLVLSLPAWPLMLACIRFNTLALPDQSPTDRILPFQFVAVLLVWLGSMSVSLLLGILVGWRSQKAPQAAGLVMALQLGLVLFGPIVLALLPKNDFALWFFGVTNPYLAIMSSASINPQFKWLATGWPFLVVNVVICSFLWKFLLNQLTTGRQDSRA